MRFTRRTYRIAIKRSFKAEYQMFRDHSAALRGPDPWYRQMKHTQALRSRRRRELGKP